MPYKKATYSHKEIEGFFYRDLLIVKQVCMNAIASIHQGKETSTSQMINETTELLKWFYPNGTKYDCGNRYCEICYPQLKNEHSKESHIFVSPEGESPFP